MKKILKGKNLKMQNRLFKEKKEKLIVGCLAEMIRLSMLTPSENKFASSLIDYYKFRGELSEKQVGAGWKTLMRLIQERDPLNPFPPKQPAFLSF